MMDVVYKNDNFRKAVEPRPEGSGTRHCALFRCGFIFKNEELCIKMMKFAASAAADNHTVAWCWIVRDVSKNEEFCI